MTPRRRTCHDQGVSDEIKRDVAMPNDVGEWGDKDTRGAWPAQMTIAGETVEVAKLPKFGDDGPDAPGERDACASDDESAG